MYWKIECRCIEKGLKVVKWSILYIFCILFNDLSVYYYEVNVLFKELWWNCKTLKFLINFSLKYVACLFCLKYLYYY